MRGEDLAEEIKTLPESYISQISDFIVYLKLKEKFDDYEKSEISKKNRLSALSEFAGSMKNTWEGIDALDYQKNLREERNLG